MHTLTNMGSGCALLGGCGPLSPLPGLHLLESPDVAAGLAQQHRLMQVAAGAYMCARASACLRVRSNTG